MPSRKPETEPSGGRLPVAPATLFDQAQQTPAFGRYLGLIPDLGTDRWDGSRGLLSARRTQRKTWIFMGAFCERFMVGFAIVDAGLVATAFAYVFDRAEKRLWEDKMTVPLGFPASFAGRLDGSWALDQKGRRFSIVSEQGKRLAHFQRQATRAGVEPFELRLEASTAGQGMSSIAPAPPDRPFNFTYKECDLELRLELCLGGARHTLPARGMLDFTLGYPPRRTFWNWAAGHGMAGASRVGFNLVAHFNAGLENALWIDGRVIPLSEATFCYDPKDLYKPWQISTSEGVLEASFEPDGQRAENIQAVLLASQFVQLFGRFHGSVMVDGKRTSFTANGVVEEHHALW